MQVVYISCSLCSESVKELKSLLVFSGCICRIRYMLQNYVVK